MAREYDLVVIGTGTSGSIVAFESACAGLSVAIADRRPFGGTCAMRGCIPKKVLAGAAEIVERCRGMRGRGVSGDTGIHWTDLMNFKRTFTDPVPGNKETAFLDAGIDIFHGHARFTGRNTVSIGDDELAASAIVIATGAEPRPLNVPGEEHLTTSDRFLETDTLPERIVFIGGGYISFEFAHIAARAGAGVAILQRSGRLLGKFDPDLVDMLVQASDDAGIRVYRNMPVRSIESGADAFIVRAGKDDVEVFEADMVVHGAGRVPAIERLDLERAGIETDPRGIAVNEYLQSVSNPSVYVVGDANSRGIQLSPVADGDAEAVAINIVEGNIAKPDYSVVPSVVFTIPTIASVGLTEERAKERGLRYVLHTGDASNWLSAQRIGLNYAGYKILVDPETDRILGAHLLGDNAGEFINLFALAIKTGITTADLKSMIWAYPTTISDIRYML